MQLFDFTHPERLGNLALPHDFRSANYYVRLPELPRSAPYYHADWVLFKADHWLEAASAWAQAQAINEEATRQAMRGGFPLEEVALVIGSDDPLFDDALGCGLQSLGWKVKMAEVLHADA